MCDPSADVDCDTVFTVEDCDDTDSLTVSDMDSDCLYNQCKDLVYNMDPLNQDSDEYGISDEHEVNVYKTDSLDPDTDNDGCEDAVEVSEGTDPLSAADVCDWRQKL